MKAARVWTVPARYRRYLEASLALVAADIGRDVARRSRGDRPTINDQFLSPEPGRIAIVVGTAEEFIKRRGRGRPRAAANAAQVS